MKSIKDMRKFKRWLQERAVKDYHKGLSIDSYYDIPLERHTERWRAVYETSYREERKKEGRK